MDNIREVIHIFKQYKLIDYFQEGGRAGRNNNFALNTLFVNPNNYLKAPKINERKINTEFEKYDILK